METNLMYLEAGVSTDRRILAPVRGAYALSYTIEYASDLGIREGDVYLQ
jgi:hypothetical protein